MNPGQQETAIALAQGSDLTMTGGHPAAVLAQAQVAAAALRDVISRKANPVKFNGEQYLEFEDWLTVARFYGLSVASRDTKYVEYGNAVGFEAKAEVIVVGTGMVISSADSMCLNDELNWKRKPLFQLRSMAQTRACARALRNVLSWVVVLAGYKATPSEEMDGKRDARNQTEPPEPGWKKEMIEGFQALKARLGAGNEYLYYRILNDSGVEHANQFRNKDEALEAFNNLKSLVAKRPAPAAAPPVDVQVAPAAEAAEGAAPADQDVEAPAPPETEPVVTQQEWLGLLAMAFEQHNMSPDDVLIMSRRFGFTGRVVSTLPKRIYDAILDEWKAEKEHQEARTSAKRKRA